MVFEAQLHPAIEGVIPQLIMLLLNKGESVRDAGHNIASLATRSEFLSGPKVTLLIQRLNMPCYNSNLIRNKGHAAQAGANLAVLFAKHSSEF